MSTVLPPRVSGGTRLTSDVGSAPQPTPAIPAPADLDAVLTVLAGHVRELAPLGAVRVTAGSVTVEIGPGTPASAPAPVSAPAPPIGVLGHSVGTADPEPASVVGNDGPTVCSTTVGVFYRAAEPGSTPFVAEGDTVAVGQQVGIVEAMKLMIPLESDRAGTVVEILVGDGEAVEHGQPVLRLAGDAVQRSTIQGSST